MEEDDITSCNNNYPNYHKPNQKDMGEVSNVIKWHHYSP
jgi:hypothetical protein